MLCKELTLRSGQGIREADIQEICNLLTTLPAKGISGLAIAVDSLRGTGGPSDDEVRDCLRSIVGIVTEAATPAAVAVVFPTVNRRLLSLAVEGFNADEGDTPLAEPSDLPRLPVLVVGPEGRHYWIGANPEVRSVLRIVSRSSEPLPLDQLPISSRGRQSRLATVRTIIEQTDLLDERSGRLSLTLRPQDATDAIANYVAEKLVLAIARAEAPGVMKGAFLTHSLRITDRWCDLSQLLAHLNLERFAGFALAAKVDALIHAAHPDGASISILRVGSISHELVSVVTHTLIGSRSYSTSVDGLSAEQPQGSKDAELRVLIVTDLVSTGNAVTRASHELSSRGISVVAVAAVVDARSESKSGTDQGFLISDAEHTPLVSLAHVDLELKATTTDTGQLLPIDPVLRRPHAKARRPALALVDQERYIKTLLSTGAARLGHIRRPAGRHYTAYVDPTILFRDSEWATLVINRMKTKLQLVRGQVMGQNEGAPVCILYATETGDSLVSVAERLAETMRLSNVPVVSVVPVPRAVLGTDWRFPPTVPVPPHTAHIVILDSAIGTGRSAQQLIRMAADCRPAAINVIALLNGLDDMDALAMQYFGSARVQGRTQEFPGENNRTDIPVRMDFVTRTAVTNLDSRDCTVCALRRKYDSLPLQVPLPARLAEQREWLLRTLDLTSKRRAYEEEPTDLFGAYIDQADCVEYLRWRYALRNATFDTVRRRHLVDEITNATGQWSRRDALVRLLVAESHWLGTAPLWFRPVRNLLADLAESLILGDPALPIDPVLRVQAVILLANVDQGRFVSALPRIVHSNADQKLVVGQVALEVLLLMIGQHMQRSTIKDRMVRSATQHLIRIDHQLRRTAKPDKRLYYLTRSELHYLISHGRRILQPAPTDAQWSWEALRNYWMSVRDHGFDAPIWRVEAALRNLGMGVSPREPESVREDWRTCSEFIGSDVLPYMKPLHGFLTSERVVRVLKADDAERWTHIANGNASYELDRLTATLDTLLTGSFADPAALGNLTGDVRWWSQFFLAARASASQPGESAFLVELVKRCPAALLGPIQDTFSDVHLDAEGVDDLESLRVFCTEPILRDLLTHIRMNAETHRSEAGDQRFLIRVGLDDDEKVQISVYNSHTEPSEPSEEGGKGLPKLESELAWFGGAIQAPIPVEPPWTYGAAISLELWRFT
jgi:orotate phosphoribosyltransferase